MSINTVNIKKMINRTNTSVRFSEVDSMRIVWHGNYVKYFEDGREAFGKEYSISYMQMFDHGYMTPLVHIECDYKRFLRYEEGIIIETEYEPSDAAKIIFNFRIYRQSNLELVCTGKSIQVFLDKNGELVLTILPFYNEWKKKWNQV
ncbi:MAG: acyl-CoA thioesterase [Bacteroidales bacterium]|nr:acyl-CoA thioesterase [Bacteroidales bacterium]